MGVMSRRVLPACADVLCLPCPGLRPSSRRPVKRYNKFLATIFLHSEDGSVNEKAVGKLAEYAAQNPDRIPKILGKLEERGFREFRSRRFGSLHAVMACYNRMMSACKAHMPLLAGSALSLIQLLLDSPQVSMKSLGATTLAYFVANQTDTSHARSIDTLLPSVLLLLSASTSSSPVDANSDSAERDKKQTEAAVAALSALAATILFLSALPHTSLRLEEVISAVLDALSLKQEERRKEMGDLAQGGRGGKGPQRLHPISLIGKSTLAPEDVPRIAKDHPTDVDVLAHVALAALCQLAQGGAMSAKRVTQPMLQYFSHGQHWPDIGTSGGEGGGAGAGGVEGSLAGHVLGFMVQCLEDAQAPDGAALLLSSLLRFLDDSQIASNFATTAAIVAVLTYLLCKVAERRTAGEDEQKRRKKGPKGQKGKGEKGGADALTSVVAAAAAASYVLYAQIMADITRQTRKCIKSAARTPSSSSPVQGLHETQLGLSKCMESLCKIVPHPLPSAFDIIGSSLDNLSADPATSRSTLSALLLLHAHAVQAATSTDSELCGLSDGLVLSLSSAMLGTDMGTRSKVHLLLHRILLCHPHPHLHPKTVTLKDDGKQQHQHQQQQAKKEEEEKEGKDLGEVDEENPWRAQGWVDKMLKERLAELSRSLAAAPAAAAARTSDAEAEGGKEEGGKEEVEGGGGTHAAGNRSPLHPLSAKLHSFRSGVQHSFRAGMERVEKMEKSLLPHALTRSRSGHGHEHAGGEAAGVPGSLEAPLLSPHALHLLLSSLFLQAQLPDNSPFLFLAFSRTFAFLISDPAMWIVPATEGQQPHAASVSVLQFLRTLRSWASNAPPSPHPSLPLLAFLRSCWELLCRALPPPPADGSSSSSPSTVHLIQAFDPSPFHFSPSGLLLLDNAAPASSMDVSSLLEKERSRDVDTEILLPFLNRRLLLPPDRLPAFLEASFLPDPSLTLKLSSASSSSSHPILPAPSPVSSAAATTSSSVTPIAFSSSSSLNASTALIDLGQFGDIPDWEAMEANAMGGGEEDGTHTTA